MLTVCVVQSSITDLVVAAALRRPELRAHEVVILGSRGWTSSMPAGSVPFDAVLDAPRLLSRPVANLRDRRRFRAGVERLAKGRPFRLLVPGLGPWGYLALATDPLCREIHLVEEGVGSFGSDGATTRPLGSRPAWIQRLMYGSRIAAVAGGVHPELVSGTFAMSPDAFPWMASERRVVVTPVFMDRPRADPSSTDAVLVVERLADEGYCSLDEYGEALEAGLARLRREGCRRLQVKRPLGLEARTGAAVEALVGSMGFDTVEALDASVSLEELAWSERPAFLGVMSSALLYAGRFGARAWSLADRMEAEPIGDAFAVVRHLFDEVVEQV